MRKKIGIFLSFILLLFIAKVASLPLKPPEVPKNQEVLGAQSYGNRIYISGSSTYAAGGVIALTSEEPAMVAVDTYGVTGDISVDIYKADMDAVISFLVHDKEGKQVSQKTDTGTFTSVATQKLTVSSQGSERSEIQLPIGTTETGVWFLRLTKDGKTTDAFVIRSSFGVVVKEGDNQLIFWGQEYGTKRSITSGQITVYSLENEAMKLSSTGFGPDGVAITGLTAGADIALAGHNSDEALVPVNLQHLNYGYSYDTFRPKSARTVYFVFTDRPLYRPGDRIYFKTILRQEDDVRYTIPIGTARVKAFEGWDDEKTFFDQVFPVTSDGTVYGEIQIPQNTATGYYTLKVSLEGQNRPTDYSYWEANTVGFQVQNFRKPEYSIDIESDQKELIAGDTLDFTVSGEFFSGQPLTGDVKYTIRSGDYWDWEYYADTTVELSDEYRYGYYYSNTLTDSSSVFDSKGIAAVSYTLDNLKAVTSQVVSVEAVYGESTGNPSFARKNFLVRPAQFGIYRFDYRWGYEVGKPMALTLKLRSYRQDTVGGIEVKAKVTRKTWEQYYTQSEKYPQYREVKEEIGDYAQKSTSDGSVAFSLTPAKTGSYIFDVSATDTAGNTVSRSFYAWVSKEGDIWYPDSSHNGLTIVTDRESYDPADTAILTLTSEIPDRDVFLTFERDRVDRYQVVRLSGSSAVVSKPFVSTDVPNIFAAVSSFSDTWLDSARTDIEVSAKGKKLTVDVVPDREVYGPGDTVTLNVSTRDLRGNGVSADVAVWAVDKAIFELVNEPPLNIFDAFWYKRYDNTSSSHSLVGITVNMAEAGGCFAAGTDILMADGKEQKIESLEAGDVVLTRKSQDSAEIVEAKISEVTHTKDIGYIRINGNLDSTPDHILYVNGGWKTAGDIRTGDLLYGKDGKDVEVSSVEYIAGKVDVYNLEVDGYHTFFAGGVWVHNQKGGADTRDVFKDTAYWNPSIRTSGDGSAQVRFKLPDNLTTWVVAAVGVTPDTVVGKDTTDVRVSKNVIVRPILPNIYRQGDEMVLRALVSNNTGADRVFSVEMTGEVFEIPVSLHEGISVKNGDTVELSWNASPKSDDADAKLSFIVWAADDEKIGDRITVTLPTLPFGFREKSAKSSSGSVTYPVVIAADTDPARSTLILSLSPSLAGALVPSMKYLVDYPYGCIEQTTSRFVPAVIAKLNPSYFGTVIADKNINDMIETGVKRISDMQQTNGGWTWWFQGPSDLYVSSYVMEYLLYAKNAGADVDENVLSRARSFIASERKPENWNLPDSSDAAVIQAYTLSLFADFGPLARLTYHTKYPDVNPEILAMEVMANTRNGYTNPAENGFNELLRLSQTQGDGVFWPAGRKEYFGSIDTATAFAVRAILAQGTHRDMAEKAVRYLLSARRYDYWSNTFATSQVVRAVTDYSNSGSEDNPDLAYSVTLGTKTLASGNVTSASQKISDISIKPDPVISGTDLVVAVSGRGNLYSTYVLSQFRTDRAIAAESHGMNVARSYENAKGSDYTIGVGDTVNVTLTVSGVADQDYYGVLEDQLPSGMVPVIETLKNEQYADPASYYSRWDNYGKEYTQNGVILSSYRWGGGTRVYTYKARAVAAGSFIVPPATSELMYKPEINARTGVSTIAIQDQSKRLPSVAKKVEALVKGTPKASTLFVIVMGVFASIASVFYIRHRKMNGK